MAIRPFPYDSLPRVGRRDINALAALRRLLGASAPQALVRWGGACVRAPVRCGVPRLVDDGSPAALRARGAELFELRGPQQQRGWLGLDATLGATLSARLLGLSPAGPAQLPLGLAERGVVCYALGWLIGELSTDFAWRIVAEPVATPAVAPDDVVGFESALWLGDQRGFAWLSLSRGALLLSAQQPRQRVASAQRLRWLRATPLVIGVELARLSLSRDDLDGLSPGDVVVSPSLPGADVRVVALRLGRGRLLAQRGDLDNSTNKEKLVVTEGYRDDLDHQLDDGAAPADATLTDALPVELVVELGRMHIRGGQALDLEVGDVLTLSRPLQGGVELRVGGQLVGRGELVDVDGEAGVRILEMND